MSSPCTVRSKEMKVILEIPEEKIGAFLGAKGKNIRFIIGKTKRELTQNVEGDVDLSGLFCRVNIDEDTREVSALLKANEDDHLENLKKNILAQQDYVLGRIEKTHNDDRPNREQPSRVHPKRKSSQFSTKYVFKTAMEHHMIPKFIGSKGMNIQDLKGKIILSDENLDGNKININICEDRKIRLQRLHFELLKTDFESPSKVLITVELNTTNRSETLSIVRDFVKEFVEKTNTTNHGGFTSQNNGESTSQNNGGFTPDDSGELENPF